MPQNARTSSLGHGRDEVIPQWRVDHNAAQNGSQCEISEVIMNPVQCSESGLSVSFYILSESHTRLGVLDITIMDRSLVKDLITQLQVTDQHPWYYFNRIMVPAGIKPQNAGILLYQALVKWADEKQVYIYNEIQPYPNSRLTAKQIITIESLFGFKRIKGLEDNQATVRLVKKD